MLKVKEIDWQKAYGGVWRTRGEYLKPLYQMQALPLDRLLGIERQKQQLLENTRRFLADQPCNHALLWGSRGTGKSSLIKSLLKEYHAQGLRALEIPRESLDWLPEISDQLEELPYHFLIFCDDLSFESGDSGYKALKTLLEGSLETPPANIRVYATSNRRHLLPESHQDNAGVQVGVGGELHPGDAVEEKISLADRFGLSLSFYQGDLDHYLTLVDSYFPDFQGDRDQLRADATLFARMRASYSGRTALQFYNSRI
ncbi:ATP-binding protein [Marinospirillum perlucidum]|uniref:ATP-binding protein n=1 Tax=Marinospirillum perlucidum TaxID=1982602 RepID=UPI001FE40C3D|nr:ATP-binding protein [Marinospirillum perlucidum]